MNENFDIAKFENIIRLFPLKWFEDEKNKGHILFERYKKLENNPKDKYYLKYFHEIDKLLDIVFSENQMSKDMKHKLNNQFEDTISEIKVFAYLILNGIKCKFEKFPDIKIINREIRIEVKNIYDSKKLTDNIFCAKRLAEKPEYMEELDDISRMRSRIDEVNKIDDTMLNIIIIDVTNASSILSDEFEYSLIENYNKISAIVMLEGKYLKNLSFKV